MPVDSVCNILINISTALFASLIAAADAAAALSSFDKKMNEKANKDKDNDDDEKKKIKKPDNCWFSKKLTHLFQGNKFFSSPVLQSTVFK